MHISLPLLVFLFTLHTQVLLTQAGTVRKHVYMQTYQSSHNFGRPISSDKINRRWVSVSSETGVGE